jgi:hypothetical protein
MGMSGARSEEVQRMIYEGVPVTTLGEIFGLDHKDVNKRLVGRVSPVRNADSKDKVLKYRIRDAAPYLCEMKMDPEEMIKSISPSKLPPALQDAFWKALNSRQKWEENRGELWRTPRIFEVVSGAFKVIRLTILMFVDTVSQRTELSPEQRRIIQDLGDGLLRDLNERLNDEFTFNYTPKIDEHGMPLTEQEALASQVETTENAEVDPFE